jgi:chromosome partitioning protein
LPPRRIAFINEKGGSGKTTLVANIAAYFANQRGYRVLAIDMDPQGQLGRVLGLEVHRPSRSAIELLVDTVLVEPRAEGNGAEPEPPATCDLPITATRIPNLDVVVANRSLALYPAWTSASSDASEGDPTNLLCRRLDGAEQLEDYDFVLFDAPPSFGHLTLNILRASDEVVVPVPLTFLALDGFAEFTRTLELVRRQYRRPGLRLSMVVPTFHRRTRLAQEILDNLAERFPKELSQEVVGYHVKIDEAQSRGLSIFEYAPHDRGASTLAALAEELEARGEANHARAGEHP